MGNSSTKSGKPRKRVISLRGKRHQDPAAAAKKKPAAAEQAEPEKTRPTPKRTLSLRPDGNTIETLLPRYYEVDWSKKAEVGKGHYATVFRGKYKATGQPVALKRIKRSLARPATLRTEIRALAAVKGHPNIVQMHDVFYNSKHVVLVMELLGGGELFDRIVQNGAYSERDASQHVRKIASALQFMHSQGIVHRDMKPENLVLVDRSPNSEIKISDFGLSKILKNDQTTMVTVCGTRAYSAPEVNFGGPARSGRYTEKVDTWSLGVILYVILAAYHPFDPYGESNDSEIWSRICSGQWDFNDDVWKSVSNEAKDLITHLICIDPNKRFGTQDILQHKWITQYQHMPATPLRSQASFSSRSLRNVMQSKMSVPAGIPAANGEGNGQPASTTTNPNPVMEPVVNPVVNSVVTPTLNPVAEKATEQPVAMNTAATESGDVVMTEASGVSQQDFEQV